MKIGIDARLYGLKHAGIGRYVKNLVEQVVKAAKKHQLVLFVREKADFEWCPDNVKIVELDVPHYSIGEQLVAADAFEREGLDVLHVPHFNVPVLYRGKVVVTIHDLIKHESRGPETTTRHRAIYWLKFAGYRCLSWMVARKAMKIIVPSEYVKSDIVRKLNVTADKIDVIYEAVEESFVKMKVETKNAYDLLGRFGLVKPFMVYTGSVYPHKNLDLILEAVGKRNQEKKLDFMLAVVCARSVFFERLERKILDMKLGNVVKLMGFLSDQELADLYSQAFCLVQPSRMEGFGLTGLEAMSRGLPVVAASSSCLPEVYGQAALYFDPDSVEDFLARVDELVTDQRLYEQLKEAGLKKVGEYSWKRNAAATLKLYEEIAAR